jgi:drug/metabolite transporter (DMT)-like permease
MDTKQLALGLILGFMLGMVTIMSKSITKGDNQYRLMLVRVMFLFIFGIGLFYYAEGTDVMCALKTTTKKEWGFCVVISVLTLASILITLKLLETSDAHNIAMYTAMTPIWVLLLGVLIYKQGLNAKQMCAMALIISGFYLLNKS